MTVEIKVPVLPESVTDATVATWHKKPGEVVKQDENIVDIETDKVVLEVVAPADGVLANIIKNEGETVTAEEVIATFNASDAAVARNDSKQAPKPQAQEPQHQQAQAPAPELKLQQDETAGPNMHMSTTAELQDVDSVRHEGAEQQNIEPINPHLSPSARRIAAETGAVHKKQAAIAKTARDVPNKKPNQASGTARKVAPVAAIHQPKAKAAPPTATINKIQNKPAAPALPQDIGARSERRVPMTRLRARIADRLLSAQSNAAILTTFNEINMQPIIDLRGQYKDNFEKTYGVRLGFMSFFVLAAVEALRRFPIVNAYIDGNDIVYHDYYDISIAVSSPRGLVVPVLRDANRMSMAAIERKIREYGAKATEGNLSIDDMTGGTFTISNGGVFGSLMSTPILNPPQSAILGMHKVEERPVVEAGHVVVRPMMYVALSYDHRIIDGADSVRFLATIKEVIEDPSRMLLGV